MAGIKKTGFRVTGRLDVSKIEKEYNSRSKRAMTKAVSFWHSKTVTHAPVKTGQTKQRTQPFVEDEHGRVVGGLSFGTHYALYLIFGADVRARQSVLRRVKQWRIGDPPITNWAAKNKKGGAVRTRRGLVGQANARAMLPLALPFAEEAADILKENMKG